MLKAVPPPGKTCDSACMDRSVSIMRSRIDKLGVSEPEIRKQGSNQIVIQLAGVHDANKAAQIIGTTAQLQFYDLEKDVVGPSTDGAGHVIATGSLYDLLTKVKADAKNGGSQYYLFNAKKKLVAGPEDTRERLLNSTLPGGRKLNGTVPDGFTVLAVPPKRIVISCDQVTTGCPGVHAGRCRPPTVYYLFKYDPNAANPVPGGDGRGPEALRHRGRHQHAGPGQRRPARLHGQGRERSSTTSRAPRLSVAPRSQRPPARPAATRTRSTSSRSTSRSCSTASSSRRRTSTTSRTPTGSTRAGPAQRSRTSRASARRRTSRSSSRPVRCRSSSSRSSAPTSRRRSARTRSSRRSSPR